MTRPASRSRNSPASPQAVVRHAAPVERPSGGRRLPAEGTPVRRRRSRRAIPVSYFIFGGLAAATLLGFLAVAAVLTWYTYYQSSQRIVPGVHLGALSLSGMTVDEAVPRLIRPGTEGAALRPPAAWSPRRSRRSSSACG